LSDSESSLRMQLGIEFKSPPMVLENTEEVKFEQEKEEGPLKMN
jgi:hypothetical protein